MEKVPFVTRRMALTLVENYLELFAQREFNKLKKALDCDDEDLREAQVVIKSCNPHPGAPYAGDASDYVVPDVIVKRAKNGWQVTLNRDVMPKLRVNAMYANILKQNKGEGSLTSQLQEAKWLIKNMRQRFDTILRVAQAIVERQRNFFSHGEVAMKPLVLREIADTLGLHESTISRVTTQKYMLTPHGMFELKYFFGSHVATEAGGEASSTAIRALIKQLIGAEDTKNPFSDSKITDMLAEQGMVVARRTVAKYREALKIPPVNLRKSL
jgi:RNA polymerase sigma-54 factor